MLTTYVRYVLVWAASEKIREGVKHDLVYELSFGPFVVFTMFRGAPERGELQ